MTDPALAQAMSSTGSRTHRRRKRIMLLLSVDGTATALIVLGALGAAFLVIFLGLLVANLAACLHLARH